MIILDVIINYRSRMQSRVCAQAMRKLRHSSLEPSPKLSYYMKFRDTFFFANFAIQKNHEMKVTRTISVANITWREN